MKVLVIFISCIGLVCNSVTAQYIFKGSSLPQRISLTKYAAIADAGQRDLDISHIINNEAGLNYKPIVTDYQNIGFTKDHFWIKLNLENKTRKDLVYYLETARPVTDHVDLYTIDDSGKISQQHNGDDMPFSNRSFNHRKAIFELSIPPGNTYKIFIHLKSDGEVISLPLFLLSADNLLDVTYLEQIVFGFFYGILILAAIIYLFFYFGMRDKSFLFYSLYVVFIGLLQFALDGYFYQYITPGGGWFSLHAVLIFATIAAFFLGKYGELYLNIPKYNKALSKVFRVTYVFIGVLFLCLISIPSFFSYAYPVANLFGLIVLGLIIYSTAYLMYKRLPVDRFFTTGIIFLVAGFVLFILNNFNLIPITFLSQNSSKLGTGLEVIFISLSMANRIRRLRQEREEMIDDLLISNQDLKQFTYITSHDLRAPISNLMGLLSLYDTKSVANPRNQMVIEKINESTSRLNDTVSDLINILHIKNNTEIERTNINFKDTLNAVVLSLKDDIAAAGAVIKTNFSAEESIYFNKNYLESIFLNLLTNAIRYRSPSRGLVIDIKSKIKTNTVQLLFSDNGSGINLNRHKEKVFGMHQKFHENTGTKGVGLYIIKSQINSLGGNINIESEEHVGTTFIITFK